MQTVDDADHTPDVNEALTLIFYAPNEFSAVAARTAVAATATAAATTALPTGVTDRIGTLDAKGSYWNRLQAKVKAVVRVLQQGELTAGRGEFVPVVRIVSMYRAIEEGVGVLSATNVGAAVAS